jgi:hypothetical protein
LGLIHCNNVGLFLFIDNPYCLPIKHNAAHPKLFPKEKLEWAVRMVLEKEAKVESTAIREMREEVKNLLDLNK